MNILLFLFPFLFYSPGIKPPLKKEALIGKHWAGSCSSSSCDTMEYRAFKKYDGSRYQWGGCAEGMEFYAGDSAQTFSNVMCSDESSPVDFYASTWQLKADTLTLDEQIMVVKYKVISVSKREMKLLNLGFEMKNTK